MRAASFDLAFLRLLKERYVLSDDEFMRLSRLEKGYAGECRLDASIEKFGLGPFLLKDLWITEGKLPATGCQIDAILAVNNQLVIIECKDFSGRFSYSPYHSKLNGYPYDNDLQGQAQRQRQYIRKFFQSKGLAPMPIKALVVFINPDIVLENRPGNFLTLADWQEFLARLSSYQPQVISPEYWQVLRACQYQNPYRPRSLSSVEQAGLDTGIFCQNCGERRTEQSRYKCHCLHCGHREGKSHAYLRTIYEFAILYHGADLTLKEIIKFFGDKANRDLIAKLLVHHAESLGRGRNAKHRIVNPHLKWHDLKENPLKKLPLHGSSEKEG